MAEVTNDIILKVNLDTGSVESDLQNLNKEVGEVGKNVKTNTFASLRQELKAATLEAQNIAAKVGLTSQEFANAAKKVADLKDQISDTNDVLAQFNPDNKLQGVVNIASGAIAAIQGVAGAFAILGVNADTANEIVAKLQGLMALGSAISQIDNIKNAYIGLKSALGGVTTSAGQAAAANTANAAATAATGTAAGAATPALISFRTVLQTLGIGLVVGAIGLLVANLDKLKEVFGGASEEAKRLEEVNKRAAQAEGERIATLTILIERIKKGGLTQREKTTAVNEYNEKLGDTLGKVKSYDELEKRLISNGPRYLEYLKLKAKADAAYLISIELQKKVIEEELKDPASFATVFERWSSGGLLGFIFDDKNEVGRNKKERVLGTLNADVQKSVNLFQQLQTEAEAAAEGLKLPPPTITGTGTGTGTGTKTTKPEQDIKANNKRVQEETLRFQQQTTVAIIEDEFERAKKQIEINRDTEKKKFNDLKLSKEVREAYEKAVDAKFDADKKKLEEDRNKKILDEEIKLQKQISEFNVGEIKNRQQQRLDQIQEDYDKQREVILNNTLLTEEKKNALILELDKKRKEAQANANAEAQVESRVTQAETGVIDAELGILNATDFDAQLVAQQNYYNKRAELEFAEYERQKQAAAGNKDELARIESQYNLNVAKLDQERKETTQRLEQERFDVQVGTLNAIGDALGALGSIFKKESGKAKALNIANAVMNTGLGITQIWANKTVIPEPFGTAQKVAATIVAAASGYKAIKTILDTKVEGGSSGGNAPTNASAFNPIAPQLQLTNLTQQVQDVRVTNQPGQAPVRAYIVQDDLTQSQQKQDFLNKLSNF